MSFPESPIRTASNIILCRHADNVCLLGTDKQTTFFGLPKNLHANNVCM